MLRKYFVFFFFEVFKLDSYYAEGMKFFPIHEIWGTRAPMRIFIYIFFFCVEGCGVKS